MSSFSTSSGGFGDFYVELKMQVMNLLGLEQGVLFPSVTCTYTLTDSSPATLPFNHDSPGTFQAPLDLRAFATAVLFTGTISSGYLHDLLPPHLQVVA